MLFKKYGQGTMFTLWTSLSRVADKKRHKIVCHGNGRNMISRTTVP